ncbi:hypothetical protein N7456_010975 [Penicillium angulare]|uniref:DH domain-containing protein n=1 Tax=Penicillium angulare TaxID=116970 RepID=A0A9W9JZA0_9EURO|nr:hypothetical protein N7456_010975 [Penicillium angulare]
MMEYQDPDESTDKLLEDGLDEKDVKDKTSTLLASAHAPFKRWVDTLRKPAAPKRPAKVVEGWPDEPQEETNSLDETDTRFPDFAPPPQLPVHDSSSGRSYLGTVKTTTLSIATRSRRTTHSTTTQSAMSDARASRDSSRPSTRNYMDEKAEERAGKRRLILRELVKTEEDYATGLKALTGVLSIFNTRTLIQHNIQQIYKIHEQFLNRLREITPSSFSQTPEEALELANRGLSKRLGNIDLPGLKGLQNRSLRTRSFKAGMKQRRRSLIAEPSEAYEVACELGNLSTSFSAYAEFCGNYELLSQDIAILRRSIPNWSVYDQGIEALSKSVASTDSRRYDDNKSMTMNDLMIKPIQRLCKYPLLLQDLNRNTAVTDCPTSQENMKQILENLRVQVASINSATGNPVNKDRIQKTLVLQEKIRFDDSSLLQDVYRDLGPMSICGVLHVTYHTSAHTAGEFMVCVLFNCYLLLAQNIDESNRLDVVACIYINDLKSDTLHNGRGLKCYGCPWSWKILFKEQGENFEFVLSAATSLEEKQWKTELLLRTAALADMAEPGGNWNPRRYSLLNLPLVALDRPQYTVASLPRRSSMDSMAITRKSNVQQVIVRKTHCPNNYDESTGSGSTSSAGEIERPKTPATRGSWTVTARRMDRVRLEKLISEVYTRDVLPYPGMVLGRGDIFRRGSIMRRLSFHAGFTKRSSSVSTSHSGPVVTESHAVEEYDGEEKDLITAQDGCSDQPLLGEDCESPKTPTPTSPVGRSKTLRFKDTKKSGSLSRKEKRSKQEKDGEMSPRRKWGTPINLLSVLSPKNIIRSRGGEPGGN